MPLILISKNPLILENCLKIDELKYSKPLLYKADEKNIDTLADLAAKKCVPLAIAAFVFGKGDPRTAIPCACMIGRDADTTATAVGSWVGALHGESGLPKEWVKGVCEVNLKEIDIRDLAEKLFLLSA